MKKKKKNKEALKILKRGYSVRQYLSLTEQTRLQKPTPKMDEEKKEKQGSPENSEERLQRETVSELDRADQIAERMARENERREKLLAREEALEARRRVGGVSEIEPEPQKPKEESNIEYMQKVMSGQLNEKPKEQD